MKQTIISMENCQKCEMLKAMCPDADCVVIQPAEILQFARLVGITSFPIIVSTGEPMELSKLLQKGV